MGNGRLEAFSDGVFAVAITLLALSLTVPARASGHLASALAHQWPEDAAYVVSFLIIGIIWINHHVIVSLLRTVDRAVLITNLVLLLAVVTIPFATELLASYLRSGGADAKVATAVYGGVMEVMSLAFGALQRAVAAEAPARPVDPRARRQAVVRFNVGQVVYLTLIGVSFLNPYVALGGHAAVAVFYLFDQTGASALRSGDERDAGDDAP